MSEPFDSSFALLRHSWAEAKALIYQMINSDQLSEVQSLILRMIETVLMAEGTGTNKRQSYTAGQGFVVRLPV